jgi:DNA-binding beta-propeller fold protein YncE
MTPVAPNWQGISGQGYIMGLYSDGLYIYSAHSTVPSQVVKIDPSTMATVLNWTGSPGNQANCKNVTGDGMFIYAAHACGSTFGPVSKINPATMALVNTWFPTSDLYNTYDVAFDAGYLYAALSLSPAKVAKIEPATMTTVAVWTGASGQNQARAIAMWEGYLYVGGMNANPRVIKIDPADMTTLDTWDASPNTTIYDLIVGGSDFYAAQNNTPARIFQFGEEAPPVLTPKAYGSIPHRLVAARLI